ncbi:ROK family transcriptional regulator [Paenibacillus frigoriresistens]|uniref:ROK family transcriptional regulator n=1 Tax=Paenibacillus alginolyticus TaxID=59839 RepID=UPI001567A933|nr:ROK family transcriptional regulator [Paenibacillus frigoriresistens]NRF95097.1 ROK family transcriptional regulator [Paenibacillus frigoriresistens]
MDRTKQGTNLEDVQEMNRSLIIKLLWRKQLCSRADLAKESGLNSSTITNNVNELIKWGLIVETGVIEGAKGRRSIGIKLNSESYKVIGIRLARRWIKIGLYDLSGNEYAVKQVLIHKSDNSNMAFNKIKDLISEFIESNRSGKVIAIGVATPGPLFRSEGRIALMTHFPGWEKINIQEELEKSYGVPVYIEHDAKAGGLAQWWFGETYQEQGIMIFVAAGQGIGASIVINGQVYRGSLGMAGEIGHMSINYNGPRCECGHLGCLETYCSTSALLKSLGKDYSSLQSVWDSLHDGDSATREAVRQAAWYLGFGLVNVINAFNPERIVLGDEWSAAGDLLIDTVNGVVNEHLLPDVAERLSVELAAQNKDYILIGAATTAIDSLLNKPSIFIV